MSGLAHSVAVGVLVESHTGGGGAARAGVESLVKEKVALRAEHLGGYTALQQLRAESLFTL